MAEGQASYRTLDDLIRGEVPGAAAPPAEMPAEPEQLPDPEPLAVTAEDEPVDSDTSAPADSRPPRAAPLREHILQVLERVQPVGSGDLHKALIEAGETVAANVLSGRLTSLVQEGYVTRTGERGAYRYMLSSAQPRGRRARSEVDKTRLDYARRAVKRIATMKRRYGTGSPALAAAKKAKRRGRPPLRRPRPDPPQPAATAPEPSLGDMRVLDYRNAVKQAILHNELDLLLREIGMGMLLSKFPAEWGLDR
jgi:phage host-nuclease inhibitor protein Gam